jgi:aspartyl-tRNA(Asn)/glutamyl-tRNA(Gln) amidotransferase subunit A
VDLAAMNLCQTVEAVNKQEISAGLVIEAALKNCRSLNEHLRTLVQVGDNEAIKAAAVVDQKISEGFHLPLAGVPVVVGDDICYQSLPTGFGSKAFKEFYTPYSASAIDKLLAAGAVVVGKSNVGDMGLESALPTSAAGPALNPWDRERVAGSAAAASLAARMCLLALESDSGGSLRQGASSCGVMGLRPTVGRISRHGLHLACSSFGTAGLAALSADDLLAALRVLSGLDPADVATASCDKHLSSERPQFTNEEITIGWPGELKGALALDEEHGIIIEEARKKIESIGFRCEEYNFPLWEEALRAYHVIAMAETSSNFSRFDGIRFGESVSTDSLEQYYKQNRALAFGQEARRRSIFGSFLLSKDNYSLYYRQALKIWTLLQDEAHRAFNRFQCLLLPAVKALPLQVKAEGQVDFINRYEEDIFTAPISMTGFPALTIPFGTITSVPVGLQLVGPPFKEELLLHIGAQLGEKVALPPLNSLLKEGL